MHDHDETPIDANLLEEMGYERRDINIGTINKSITSFMIAATVIMFVGLACMWIAAPKMVSFKQDERTAPRKRVPADPNPLIQSNVTAHQDYLELVREQRTALTTYGWTDRKKGFVHQPVDQAMKDVLASGLPVRANPRVPEGETE